jgi:hypothetical protein
MLTGSKARRLIYWIGVSGTLKHFHRATGSTTRVLLSTGTALGDKDEQVPAILIGSSGTGYKAYPISREPEWRGVQGGSTLYSNAVVLPTGCREHANIY